MFLSDYQKEIDNIPDIIPWFEFNGNKCIYFVIY